jgi:Pseudouridylate synthases, 23S RNA-specific
MTSSEKQLIDYTLKPTASSVIELEIPFSSAGFRLDNALAALMPEYSRSRIQDWIKQSLVLVNGRALAPKDKVWGGETVTLHPEPHPAELPAVAEDIALDIVMRMIASSSSTNLQDWSCIRAAATGKEHC